MFVQTLWGWARSGFKLTKDQEAVARIPGDCRMTKSLTLAETPGGTRVRVVALRGGRAFQERVISMGLHVGCEAEVMIGEGEGRMILAVGDTRIALGHGMANRIMVKARCD